MATLKFRKGQRVRCIHYKDRPIVTITEYYPDEKDRKIDIWVTEANGNQWWGPKSWFKAIRPIKKPRAPKKGGLCDGNVPGCTCNQWSSVSQ